MKDTDKETSSVALVTSDAARNAHIKKYGSTSCKIYIIVGACPSNSIPVQSRVGVVVLWLSLSTIQYRVVESILYSSLEQTIIG